MSAKTERKVAGDLYRLTEMAAKAGHEISGGLLGGEFGYGAWIDNDVFMMHPFCWCERDDCPWCWGCECPEAAAIYEISGRRVSWEEWCDEYKRTGNRLRSYRQDEALACAYCRGERESAPNFLHKATGTKVRWYKYIGRGMEVDVNGDWAAIIGDCRAAIAKAGS